MLTYWARKRDLIFQILEKDKSKSFDELKILDIPELEKIYEKEK